MMDPLPSGPRFRGEQGSLPGLKRGRLTMRSLRFAFLTCLVLGLSACSSNSEKKESDKDGDKKGESERGSSGPINTDKFVGTWEITRAAVLPSGATATVEFRKDGTMHLLSTYRGKMLTKDGTYRVEGNKLTTTLTTTRNGTTSKKKTETDTIRTLDDTRLVVVDDQGQVDEYKRK